MKDVMVDLETLGTEPGSVILSIGAVEFDENGLGKEFEVYIDPDSCLKHGLEASGRTLLWWMEQSQEARDKQILAKRVPLERALIDLANAFDWKNACIWGNGAAFDEVLLRSAYTALDCDTPWKFWNVMCFRTLKNIVPVPVFNSCKEAPEVAHSALADAKAQALTAIQLLKWVNRNTKELAHAA